MIKGYIDYGALEHKVLKKLKQLGITEKDYPLNPYELISHEGIILQEIDYEDINIRGMIVFGSNVTGISINQNRTSKSKNYIAMHELSHYWYHPHHTDFVCIDDYINHNNDKEWQANNAASLALMPTKIFSKLFCECGGDLSCLSDYFNVSISAVKYRKEKMQIISKNINYNGYNIDFKRFTEITYQERLLYGTK